MTTGVESPRVAARHATLYSLHVCAATGGSVALLVWLVFHDRAAALVAGAGWLASGLLALLSRQSPRLGPSRGAAACGALLEGYGAALLVLGGLILRSGLEAHVGLAGEGFVAELASGELRSLPGLGTGHDRREGEGG
jgi:hypothetical protein